MNYLEATTIGLLVALPSLAAAQPGAAAPPPPGPAAATGTSVPSVPTDGGAAAPGAQADAPAADETPQTKSVVAGETEARSQPNVPRAAKTAANRSRPIRAPEPARADTWDDATEETGESSEPRGGDGSDADASRAKPEIRLGGMPRVHAGLGMATFRHRDAGFALFTAHRWTTGVTASAGVDFVRLGEQWLLSADADWSQEVHRTEGLFGGFGDSKFNAHTVGLGASLRYRVLDWCQPYVRAWGGFASTRAVLSVPSIDYASDRDRQYLPAFGAALGATVWGPVVGVPKEEDFTRYVSVGLRLEAGYEFTGAFDFAYDLRGPGNYPITVREPPAGTLRLDAPYIRVLVMLGAA
jgi:hypothetical protein